MSRLKSYLANRVANISQPMFFRIAYFHNRGHFLNLKKPKDISEIWIKKLLDGEFNSISYLADKYAVRSFVEEKGYSKILVPLLGCWEDSKDINFDSLPDKFALKMNFGSGMNIICMDKTAIDEDNIRKQLNEWMKVSSYAHSERHYDLIPHKIICESFIDDGHGGFTIDYKFMCLKGKPFCVLACGHRESGHAEYLPYSLNWKPLFEYTKTGHKCRVIEKPKHFSEMLEIASALSAGIDLVRVDLYDTPQKIIFGEMTLTPAGCIFHNWSQKALDDMGDFYRKQLLR